MGATKPAVRAPTTVGATRLTLVLLLLFCGCKAEVTVQPDAAVHDLSVDGGGVDVDLAGADFTVFPDLECAVGPEICGNGCDDDRNGYSDDDDPACTPQVLMTFPTGSMNLQRLVLQPPYMSGIVDGNVVAGNSHAVYVRAFAPGVAWVVTEGGAMELDRITLAPTMTAKGTVQAIPLSYFARDVCVFHNELIVVEQNQLHRLQADGTTSNGTVQLAAWTAADTHLAACASDGNRLYVAEHFGILPSQFEILDAMFSPSPSPSPLPNLDPGVDRCVDFAWTKKGFYGLFARSNGVSGDVQPTGELHAFALDGGAGPAIDAGVLHSLGEFQP
jgi:hypothetical protein